MIYRTHIILSILLIWGNAGLFAMDPRLSVEPREALITEPVEITLHGFVSGSVVTVQATTRDDLDRLWENSVEITVEASETGTVIDVDETGLFWGMTLGGDPESHGPFVKSGLSPNTVRLTATDGNGATARGEWTRRLIAQDVRQERVREGNLRGMLFTPPAKERTGAAVVVVGGSEGGLRLDRAAMLASQGITALSLAYFGYEDLPDGLTEIPLELFHEAIRWIGEQPGVDPDRVFFFGSSRGGELALILGSRFPEIAGVIAYAPGNLIGGPFGTGSAEARSAWTWQGEPLVPVTEFFTESQQEKLSRMGFGSGASWDDVFRVRMEEPEAIEPGVIKVEQTAGRILLAAGLDDQLWPSASMAKAVAERLQKHGFKREVRLLLFEDCGHAFLWRNMPTTVTEWKHPQNERVYKLGGTSSGVARAARELWPQVVDFILADH